jgi:hypothetical protein
MTVDMELHEIEMKYQMHLVEECRETGLYRPRTDLLNQDKTFPTKSLPNGIKLKVYTYLFQKGRVEFPRVGEDSILEDSVGLPLSVVRQVDEGGVSGVHSFSLWRKNLFLFLFFFMIR